jgi:formamidopyrimidine-DNA glycosylase
LEREGKLLIIRLDADFVLTVHLKMTGQLIWQGNDTVMGGHPEASYLQPLPHKHTHVIISFDDGSHLYFNDLRKFGRITLMLAQELPNLTFLETLGPEPLEADFTVSYLEGRLKQRPRSVIKSFLLDQTNIAGLGNIYADESLFRAAVLPDRLAGSLKAGEIRNLFDGIRETLEVAILHGGSSSRDYLNAVGERGTFLAVADVYHRTGQLCHRCNSGLIQRKKIGGRSSHYCPICQR